MVCDLLPGPVTLVIERPSFLPSHVNPGCDWIGVRIPNSLISQQLAQNEPLCLTSANLSGESSAITANDFAALHPQLDALVDLGPITDSDMSRFVILSLLVITSKKQFFCENSATAVFELLKEEPK